MLSGRIQEMVIINYEIGDILINKVVGCKCTLTAKVKDGLTYNYVLKDEENTEFVVRGKKTLIRDFVKEKC